MAKRRKDGRSAFRVMRQFHAAFDKWKQNVQEALGLSAGPGGKLQTDNEPKGLPWRQAVVRAWEITGRSARERANGPGPLMDYDTWKANLSGPADAPERQFSPLTKNLGLRILRMGPNVPDEIRAKAAIAVNGTTNKSVKDAELLNNFRGYLGIEESGATKLNQFTGTVRGGIRSAYNAAQLLGQAQQGGIEGSAAAGLFGLKLIDKFEQGVHSKIFEEVTEKIADKMLERPELGARLSHYLGRVGRVASTFGSIAYGAYAVTMAWVQSQDQSELAAKQRIAGFQAFNSQAQGLQIANNSENEQRAIEGWFGSAKNFFGFTGGTDASIAQQEVAQQAFFKNMRTQSSLTGGNIGSGIAQAARAMGISSDALTQGERNAVADRYTAEALARAMNHPGVQMQAQIAANNGLERLYSTDAYKAALQRAQRDKAIEFLQGTGDFATAGTDYTGAPLDVHAKASEVVMNLARIYGAGFMGPAALGAKIPGEETLRNLLDPKTEENPVLFKASPAVRQRNAEHAYQLNMERRSPEWRRGWEQQQRRVLMEAQAERKRKAVQRFD